MIDSHVHFWEYDEVRDSWMTDDMESIRRNFLPKDLDQHLEENHIDGIIAVQADQSETETQFLLKLSDEYSKIWGIVGWINLLQEGLEKRIEKYLNNPKIRGWRHIVQSEPKGFLAQSAFMKNVEKLGKYGYTYDILVYHYQLQEVVAFCHQLKNQKFILDHFGKPDLKTFEKTNWQNQIEKLASMENVYCKVSGLVTEAEKGKWTPEMVYEYLDFVIEKFGTDRVLFGSDWPVILINAGYTEWTHLIKNYLSTFSASEQQKILHENAVQFYQLKL